MSVTIAGTTFEHHHYDQRGDLLYLSVAHHEGPSASASSTPEGHNIEYDEAGRVVGMTLTNVRWLLDRDHHHPDHRPRRP
jgi:YD repeat-containing protein